MVLKPELISFTLLIQSFVQLTQSTDTVRPQDGRKRFAAQIHDITLDPNYEALVSLHAKNPQSHPPETWTDVLNELSFGPGLKDRQATAKEVAGNKRSLELPVEFDARQKWKKCKRLIGTVYDQGPCISDYAITAASVLADRLCIKKKERFKKLLSAQTLLGCYGSCQGGEIYGAFEYINQRGIPTGGLYGQKKGCIPFKPKPCSHQTSLVDVHAETGVSMEKCSSIPPVNYTCPKSCTNKKYKKKIYDDMHLIAGFKWTSLNESEIREDIMTHGPLAAGFTMYSDFKNYKDGMYTKNRDSTFEYIHKIKLIGWGRENGSDYWLAVNTFNKEWGLNGLFKFPRGKNYLFIETLVITMEALD